MRKLKLFFIVLFITISSGLVKAQLNWDYTVSNTPIIGWINLTDYNTYGNSCSDCIWSLQDNILVNGDLSFGNEFSLYDYTGIESILFNTNGVIGIDTWIGSFQGMELPNSSYWRTIQYGGNSDGKVTSAYGIKYKVWQMPEGHIVFTMEFQYQIGTTATDYTADIQIHFIQDIDVIEINYANVTGTTGASEYCGINYGDGVHSTLIDGATGSFPTTDGTYLFAPGYTDELEILTLNVSGEALACDLQPSTFSINILNKGINPQTGFDVNLYVNEILTETYTVSETINQFETLQHIFTTVVSAQQDGEIIEVSAEIDLTDYQPLNNIKAKTLIDFLSAEVASASVCFGNPATIEATGGDYYVWVNPQFPDSPLFSGEGAFTTSQNIYEPTEFWVKAKSNDILLNSIENNFTYVNHNDISGDDRGGVAITPEYFYVIGDDATVRMSTSNLAGQTALPMMDGLFSNLADGKLYTLYNTDIDEDLNYDDSSFPFTVNAIIELDENLDFTANIITLDVPFNVDINNDEGGVFAGTGVVMIKNGEDNTLYQIDIATGTTTTIGVFDELTDDSWNTENWASWGFIETIDGTPSSLLFGWEYSNIKRLDLATGVSEIAFSFEYDNNGYMPNDLHSFTYSPWEDRIYYHSETNDEDGGYFNVTSGTSGNCWTSVTLNVVEPANAGYSSNTDVCNDNSAVNLFDLIVGNPDTGGEWADVNATGALNAGIFDATAVSEGIYQFTYTVSSESPCESQEEITLTINVDEVPTAGIAIDGNVCQNTSPIYNLNDALDGTQDIYGYWSDDESTGVLSGSMINVTTLALGDYEFSYHAFGSGACIDDVETVTITVELCNGIEDISAIGLNIWPNPSNGNVQLNITDSFSSQIFVEITNIQGQIVFGQFVNDRNLNLNNLPKGFYNVKVLDNEKIYVQKLILE